MKILELFSGIGGMHYSAKGSGLSAEVVAAVDVNTNANAVYRHNFPDVRLLTRNIQSLTPAEINKLQPEMVLMSPPCQPFTRVGLKKDLSDNRSSALVHVVQLLSQLENLKYVLLENVKGFERSEARDYVVTELETLGFTFQEFLLSPLQFGIPNARLRFYLLAKRAPKTFCFQTKSELWTEIPHGEIPSAILNRLNAKINSRLADDDSIPNEDEQLPEEAQRTRCHTIRHILEPNDHNQLQEYLLPDKMLGKCSLVLDVVSANSRRSCCFTKAYGHYADGTGSVIAERSLSGVHEIRIKNQDMELGSEEQINMMKSLNLRYFTPREIARLLSFPEAPFFSFPETVTTRQCFKLLGNSVNVHVISFLIAVLVEGDDV